MSQRETMEALLVGACDENICLVCESSKTRLLHTRWEIPIGGVTIIPWIRGYPRHKSPIYAIRMCIANAVQQATAQWRIFIVWISSDTGYTEHQIEFSKKCFGVTN